MSKIKLPVLGPTVPPPAGAGPVVVGGGVAAAGVVAGDLAAKDEPPAPYAIEEVAAEDLSLGLKAHVVEKGAAAAQQGQEASTIPEGYRGETVTLPTQDVARLDELARTMLEIRGEVADVVRRVHNLSAELQRHPDAVANLHARISKLDEAHGTQIGGLMVDVKTLRVDDNGILEMVRGDAESARARFNAIDDALAAKGLPTSKAATAPTLTLRPTRVLAIKAKLDGTAVVLHYNPRQGRDGDDPQEITVREQPRPVMTGYAVDVPSGYVCDVFVGADVVASLQGKGEGELLVNMRSKGPYGRTVGGGHEICRLALRKMEAVRLVVEAVQ